MRRTPASSSVPTGFTLMEVLVVLAISGMIVLAAFGAIHTQTKLQSTGESQVERSLIRKGVFDDISSDLRSVVRPVQQRRELSSTASSLGLTSLLQPTSEFREQVLDHTQLPRQVVSFLGEADSLVMELAQPSPRFHPPESRGSVPSTFTQQVVWFCNSGKVRRVPLLRDRDRVYHATVNADQWSRGLTRVETAPLPGQSGFSSRTLTPQTGNWFAVAPEIESIQFRYFDGRNWHLSWDSHARQQIPRAIEVTTIASMAGTQSFVVRLPQGE